jgi:hypothetical protein
MTQSVSARPQTRPQNLAVNYTQQGEASLPPRHGNMPGTAMENSRSVLAPVRDAFRAVVMTVVPEAKQLNESGWLALETLVEDALEIRPPALRRQLQLFLRAIEWLPVVRYGRRFTALGDEQRGRILRYLQDHPLERIRCGFWGLRTLALLGYYGRPEAAHAIGYRPDARGWEAVRR